MTPPGDGIDSNGALYIDGGIVYISGPTNDGNSALDPDGEQVISSGVVAAAGSPGMLETPATSSTQPYFVVYYTASQEASSLIDADGTVIASFAPAKAYKAVVISVPALAVGNVYTLYSMIWHSPMLP